MTSKNPFPLPLFRMFLFLMAMLALGHGQAMAAPGDLDTSFGSGGIVTTNIATSTNSYSTDVTQQDDGKLVIAGDSNNGMTYLRSLVRYNTDGSLDTGFGENGIASINASPRSYYSSVIQQNDGKIVLALSNYDGSDFSLIRYNSDGSMDSGFDSDGIVNASVCYPSITGGDGIRDLIQDGNGKIVASGKCNSDFALARFNSDGSLDTSFGTNGKVITDISGVGGGDDAAFAIIEQPDGRLVAAGTANGKLALARYLDNGSLDTTFDGDGKVSIDSPLGATAYARSVAMQTDGKLVAAGAAGTKPDYFLARLNPDGTLDSGFDSDGKVTTTISTNEDTILKVNLLGAR